MDDKQTDTLKNIELTKEGEKPKQEIQYVAQRERGEILLDPARDTIIRILRIGIPDTITTETIDRKTEHKLVIQEHLNRHALSIVEIANLSRDKKYSSQPITKSQVYHHMNKLIEFGFTIKYGTVITGKRTTDYYRRTSELFVFANYPINEKERRQCIERDIRRIEEVYGLKTTGENEKELVDLFTKINILSQKGRSFIVERARGDIATTNDLVLLNKLEEVYAFHNQEYIDTMKRIREIIFGK